MTDAQRIPGIDPSTADDDLRKAFQQQTRKWGAPLGPHLVYARRPSILKAALGMWGGIGQSKLVDHGLQAMLNRRVAQINGCEF